MIKMIDVSELFGEGKQKTVQEHYGVDYDESEERMKDILCSFIKNDDKTIVIDKHFSDVKDAELRARIFEFAVAHHRFSKFMEVSQS